MRPDRRYARRSVAAVGSAALVLLALIIVITGLGIAGTAGVNGEDGADGGTEGGADLGAADGADGEAGDGGGGESGAVPVIRLKSPSVSRQEVGTDEEVTFSVTYINSLDLEPVNHTVTVAGEGERHEWSMERLDSEDFINGSEYSYQQDLEVLGVGEYTFFFHFDDMEGNARDTEDLGSELTVTEAGDKEGDEGEEEPFWRSDMCLLVGLVFILVTFGGLFVLSIISRAQQQKIIMARARGRGKVCPSCGEYAEEGTSFCPKCGMRYNDDKVRCSYCDELKDPGLSVCPNCGKRPGEKPVSGAGVKGRRGGRSEEGDFDEIITCTECGAVVSDEMKRCPGCGEVFEDDEPSEKKRSSGKRSPSRSKLPLVGEEDGGGIKGGKRVKKGGKKGKDGMVGSDGRKRPGAGKKRTRRGADRLPRSRGGAAGDASGSDIDFLCSVCGYGVTEDARECPKCGNRFL